MINTFCVIISFYLVNQHFELPHSAEDASFPCVWHFPTLKIAQHTRTVGKSLKWKATQGYAEGEKKSFILKAKGPLLTLELPLMEPTQTAFIETPQKFEKERK